MIVEEKLRSLILASIFKCLGRDPRNNDVSVLVWEVTSNEEIKIDPSSMTYPYLSRITVPKNTMVLFYFSSFCKEYAKLLGKYFFDNGVTTTSDSKCSSPNVIILETPEARKLLEHICNNPYMFINELAKIFEQSNQKKPSYKK